MSDKTVGIIGQKYEDRKTGKCGTLESRDDKYKTLLFKADDGSTFNISNSSFRSNWRKCKDEEVVETEPVETDPVSEEVVEQEEVTEPVDEPAPETKSKTKKKKVAPEKKETAPSKNYDGVTDDDAIVNFIDAVRVEREVCVRITESDMEVSVDENVIIARVIKNNDGTYNISMLPDLFTLVDWRGKLDTLSIDYKTGAKDYLGVVVNTKQTCIPEILDIITETVKEINVYGYTTEESEE